MTWVSRIITNIRKRGFKDILRPAKWHVFLQGEALKNSGLSFEVNGEQLTLTEDQLDSYCEQYLYRKILCNPCVIKGSCIHCSCAVPGNMLTPTNECSNNNWSEMMNGEEWSEYKEALGINFKIEYKS